MEFELNRPLFIFALSHLPLIQFCD